jgi:hypothetical protein
VQVYLVGGATAVTVGWRDSTIDIDLAFGPGADDVLRAIPAIKDSLNINFLTDEFPRSPVQPRPQPPRESVFTVPLAPYWRRRLQ